MENKLVNNQNEPFRKILISIIKWGAYLSLFSPLIINNDFLYSFVVPKTLFFRIIVEIIFSAYLILILSFPKYRPKVNALSVSVFIFVFISIITSILGVDFQRSFWSVYERETGLFTLLHLYAFFIVLSNIFRTKKDWKRLFVVSIVAGIMSSLSLFLIGLNSQGGGTIGNTSFLASYLLFNIFFAIALFLKDKFSGVGIFSTISLLIMMPVLLSIDARAAAISLFGGLVLLFMGVLFFSGNNKLKIVAVTTPIILILAILFLVLKSSEIQEIIAINLKGMNARILVWQMAWKGFLERPIFGWGMENFNVVFAKFFNPKLYLKEYGGEIWFDKTHSIIMGTLVNSGIIGLISYLSIFFVSIFSLFKKSFKENREGIIINSAIISLLIAYFVQNLFVFDMISSYIVLFLTLAFVNYLINKDKYNDDHVCGSPINGIVSKLIIFLIFISTSISLYFGNVQPAQSAINVVSIVRSTDVESQFGFYKKSLKSLRYDNEINRFFESSLKKQLFKFQSDKELLLNVLKFAQEKTKKDTEENKLNLRTRFNLSELYIIEYQLTNNDNKLKLAEEIINETIKISPNNQYGYYLLSDIKSKQGDSTSSLALIQKAIDLEPQLGSSYWYLVPFYEKKGDYEKALYFVNKAEENGFMWRRSPSGVRGVIRLYESLNRYKETIPLYGELLKSYPSDSNLWLKLGVALYNIGEKDNAKEVAERAVQINPSLNEQAADVLKVLLQ